MADIEVLIKISEEDYRSFKEDEKNIRENAETESYSLDHLEVALLNGTPLPKGHGKIINTDIIKDFKNKIKHYGKDYKFTQEKILNILERYEIK